MDKLVTSFARLPHWNPNDKPSMEDFNNAYIKIDRLLHRQEKRIATLEAEIQELRSGAFVVANSSFLERL